MQDFMKNAVFSCFVAKKDGFKPSFAGFRGF